MKNELILCSDIFAGFIYYLSKNDHKVFGSRNDVHKIIFDLRKEKKFNLLERFQFSTKGICPVSEEVENSLFSLLLTRIISYKNPYYREFEFIENSRGVIEEKIIKKFDEKQIEELQEIAKEYGKKCGETNAAVIGF